MCAEHEIGQSIDCLQRRSFLKASSAITAMAFLGAGALSSIAYADALTKEQRDKMTPSQIIDAMKKGNERFRSGVRKNRNYLNEQKATASGAASRGGIA